ncbi:hypothetical protein [Saccharicrinis sp. 156]|uniref:hypothetical protein n=1 Tax=Saccharicrinis sp. 156 TaxID=3417574 RepID=UPI003D3291DC
MRSKKLTVTGQQSVVRSPENIKINDFVAFPGVLEKHPIFKLCFIREKHVTF